MMFLKRIYNFIITYIKRPLFYRVFFIPRWELFRKPPFYFKYYGWKVFYRPKDGLVYHVGSMGSFEDDVINCCVTAMSANATIFDIGANIGLITLPLARILPNATFHCFEPSPYPYTFFKKNIKANNLESRIKVNKLGLYNRSGRIKFYTHVDRDASSDGLKDTFRAGKTKTIEVEVTTLDKYTEIHKIKKLDLLKIDIEGAELFVFKGGLKTIRKFYPKIVFEAWPKNLEAYNLNVGDVYKFFEKIKYRIFSLSGKQLNENSFIEATRLQGNYQAYPV